MPELIQRDMQNLKEEIASKEKLLRRAKAMPGSKSDRRIEVEKIDAELAQLQAALKSASSKEERRKREDRERRALSEIKKEERSKQQSGKAAWHMKDCASFGILHGG